ncbi:hypothetical protein BKA80DRAFT_273533 [Phyllosticta citrichinensis]
MRVDRLPSLLAQPSRHILLTRNIPVTSARCAATQRQSQTQVRLRLDAASWR